MVKSLCTVFLMYSRIPMPHVEWKDENRRYALCFFPLIGVVIGGLLLIWRWLCTWLGCGQLLFAVGATGLPLLVTGGIHLDGFADVADALSACVHREKRLAIMKDPHIGAFAVMQISMYLLLQTALFAELDNLMHLIPAAMGYVLSRTMSGISAVTCRTATKDSSLQEFTRPASRYTRVILLLWFLVLTVIWAGFNKWSCISGLMATAILYLCYGRMTYLNFGGITGDTAGWLVQMTEILLLGISAIGKILM